MMQPEGVQGDEGFLARREAADIDRMEAVDVLLGANGFDDAALVDVVGERELDEDAMDRGIGIQGCDLGEQVGLRGLGG